MNKKYVYHAPAGEPCRKCGLSFLWHKEKSDKRMIYEFDRKKKYYFTGVDGEGQGRQNHKYILLAAACETNESNRKWYVENPKGLTTKQCLDFLLSLPDDTKLFGYAFNYDLTKMLQDLPAEHLFLLFRPELRMPPENSDQWEPFAIPWEDYELNLQGTKFQVRKGKRHKVIWDIFKFYQSKFVNALKLWKVGDTSEIERIESMKAQRSDFDKLELEPIRNYCFQECIYLGQLARKLVNAHEQVDLKLKSFYGAGSTASCILKKMQIHKKVTKGPDNLQEQIAQAFFGGRFENAVAGPVEQAVYGYDISSAYPYQLAFLPCLLHGSWRHSLKRNDIEKCTTALVRYSIKRIDRKLNWAPFPFREKNGSICFPRTSGGGWIWKDEYIAGEKIFEKFVKFHEAWIFESTCVCPKPFGKIPEFYKERLRIGKEGPGIVLKLGPNSVYGKLAQSVGRNPPFQCWIWAGMVTSGCRAQLLNLMGSHQDINNVLAVATDGIYTLEPVSTPVPMDTGTFDCLDEKGRKANKPLGGWEEKIYGGAFFARPGIYFPLNPTEEQIDKIRARGVGRAAVLRHWDQIIQGWKEKKESITLTGHSMSRFCGAKSSVSATTYPVTFKKADSYGQWVERKTMLSFHPMPKRSDIDINYIGDLAFLPLRTFENEVCSLPYARSYRSAEALILKNAELEKEEQPDGDIIEYSN